MNPQIIPSYNLLFNYGPRSTYLNMPKNRSDLFDIATSGILTTLILSLAATFAGLKMTADSTQVFVV